jgi:hypothetical protein
MLVKDLSGAALDWAVLVALGGKPVIQDGAVKADTHWLKEHISHKQDSYLIEFRPSSCFDQGGQLIDKIGIDVRKYTQPDYTTLDARHFDPSKGDKLEYLDRFKREMVRRPVEKNHLHGKWLAGSPSADSSPRWSKSTNTSGDTFLIAAMRWHVLCQLGEKVEVPAELK